MMIIQWIGIALTIVGLAWNGVKEYPTVKKEYHRLNVREAVGSEANRFKYTTIHIAYDTVSGKHWFLHSDGVWKDFPPKP